MRFVVNVNGFIGDILFSTSIASCINRMYDGVEVIYNIPLRQPLLLLQQHPHITNVVVNENVKGDYILNVGYVEQHTPATIFMQQQCGIPEEYQQLTFDQYTIPEFDDEMMNYLSNVKTDKPIIGWIKNWWYRAYKCTPDTLMNGMGAPHRNIDDIINKLEADFTMVPLGLNHTIVSSDPNAQDEVGYAKMASLIKHVDYVCGPEGGIQNLSCSLGTKTIIESSFIAQNYWIKCGRIKQIINPQMSSHVYYPNSNHSLLDPCNSDEEIYTSIKTIINSGTPYIYKWN